jgi:coenzyme F420-0:L-glutamate ligase / coenzyme F420-1:gamma-L-glutamate ligase
MKITFTTIPNIPLIQPGDDLARIIWDSLCGEQALGMDDGDLIVLAQKIVSKAENRLVNLRDVTPTSRSHELAQVTQKDPRLVELILQESKSVLRAKLNHLIVEHNLGFVCANAGIDHSNVCGPYGNAEDWVLLLPKNPDESAQRIKSKLCELAKKEIGVMIIDSHGRAWRMGTLGTCIGLAGIPGLVDLRGEEDLFGYRLMVTQVGAADELAAGASLIMGQAAEASPVVHVRGFPYPLRNGQLSEIIRPIEEDMFR